MRFSKNIYDESADLSEREKLKSSVPNDVLAWLCNDNNRAYAQLRANADFTDFQVLNDRLTRLNTIVVDELHKISEDLHFDFWNMSDLFAYMLLMPRLSIVHHTEEDLIPKELRDFINKEQEIKARIKHEKELIEKSRQAFLDMQKTKID